MNKMKKYLFALICVMAVSVVAVSCVNSGPEPVPPVIDEFKFERSWRLQSIYDAEPEVDIYVRFSNGDFILYQRSKDSSYLFFKGNYTKDEENSILSGVYSDGTPWASDYKYTLDEDARVLILESLDDSTEISVYQPATMPDLKVFGASRAAEYDVKPL